MAVVNVLADCLNLFSSLQIPFKKRRIYCMKIPRYFPKYTLLFLTCTFAPAVMSAETCVKLVFSEFCLGGQISPQSLENRLKLIQQKDEIFHYFSAADKRIIVSTHQNKIVAVERQEVPGSWLNFTAWKVKLVRLYGRAKDQSSLPSYATSRSSRFNVIKAGKGVAQVSWPQKNWTVTLRWDDPAFIRLQYTLEQSQASARENTEDL